MMETDIYILKPLFGFGFANRNFIFKIPLLLFANVNVAFQNFSECRQSLLLFHTL